MQNLRDSFWGNIFRKGAEQETTVSLLSKIPIFAGIKNKELRGLSRIVHRRTYGPEEVIFRKNDPGVGLYIVESGSVRIVLSPEDRSGKKTANAGEIVLAKLGPGDFFGEASLPDGGPRSATAIAEEDSSLIGLFRPDLLEFCERDQTTGNQVLWNVCEVLAVRLRQTNKDLTRLRTEAVP